MLRQLIVTTGLLLAAQLVYAADAGKIIFVAGQANVAGKPVAEGAVVREGQMLSTGPDGFIYVKTIDNGLFILRPSTQARIVSYHIDPRNPANTRIKLELLSGVARSKSGDAVKLARQNFRFNTPVAAIGVRGTDFTVFTDNDTSRVAVISGGIVVSGFVEACRPEGSGPCEGGASRELSAAQRGQLLQVQRGQSAPQLLQSSPLSPDQVSPPRADEPLSKTGTVNGSSTVAAGGLNLDAKKASELTVIAATVPPAPVPLPPPAPLPLPPVDTGPVLPPAPERGILWGRFQQIEEHYAQIDLTEENKKSELLDTKGYYALLRTPGNEYVAPNNGTIGFALKSSDAIVYTDYGYGNVTVAPGTLSNGKLDVDFGRKSFSTRLDLTSKGVLTPLQAAGTVGADGQLYGDSAGGRMGVMNVRGLLSRDAAGASAGYIFDAKLDPLRTVNGGTSWR